MEYHGIENSPVVQAIVLYNSVAFGVLCGPLQGSTNKGYATGHVVLTSPAQVGSGFFCFDLFL